MGKMKILMGILEIAMGKKKIAEGKKTVRRRKKRRQMGDGIIFFRNFVNLNKQKRPLRLNVLKITL